MTSVRLDGIILGGHDIRYPILIPARTVAEVYDNEDTFVCGVLGSIGMYEHPSMTLGDWLRWHVDSIPPIAGDEEG